VILLASLLAALAAPIAPATRSIQLNDNLQPAGHLANGVLTLRLVAAPGGWRPNGSGGATVEVDAFGEEGRELSTPGPLIRAPEGTIAAVSLRNELGRELRVFGLCAKPGPCDPISIAAGERREVRFVLGAPGTYSYWASSTATTVLQRPRGESQLGGAIIVDPREGAAADRVMVISVFHDGAPIGPCLNPPPDAVFAINGASWPHTSRLRYEVGDTVRWRVINLSCDPHAMHLHGFHFTVEAVGDGNVDRPLPSAEQRTEVTELLPGGRTFALSWVPTRSGNWLFHCHMVAHMAERSPSPHAAHGAEAGRAGMAGLVMGIEVAGPPEAVVEAPKAPRRLTLRLREEPKRYGDHPGYRMDLEGTEAPRLDPGPVPGPLLVLYRGEPAEITVVNEMTEPTAIHWHGIEIESYFDGVPGFGGLGANIAQPIAPGESFVARLAPPRAGTFIYHTHWHDEAQLAGGLYGALIVLEPGERFDPETDHVVMIGLNGVLVPGQPAPLALNGLAKPAPVRLRAGVPHRLRLINITANNVGLQAFLMNGLEVGQWTPLAKDGATLPVEQAAVRPARQPIGVGETYDFEIRPSAPQNLWLEVRAGNGQWLLQAPVEIR
jgi:FtsP/CotA-like multicopper oxidase with cupredoxin domain